MRVAIYSSEEMPFSFHNYLQNIIGELTDRGIKFIKISGDKPAQGSFDLYWAVNFSLPQSLMKVDVPIVTTFLGDWGLGLPAYKFGRNPIEGIIRRIRVKKQLKAKYSTIMSSREYTIITVSNYAKEAFKLHLSIPDEKIFAIPHGVDMREFNPEGEKYSSSSPYLFHVSQYGPWHFRKNLNRILEAYAALSNPEVNLFLLVPGFPKNNIKLNGVKLINHRVDGNELAAMYRGALGFIFPSLHEAFGMPILESMACGTPVITSNVTACPEVAGEEALLVNPYSVRQIKQAMERLIQDQSLRKRLCKKGLSRVKEFTWHRSATKHLEIFRRACEDGG